MKLVDGHHTKQVSTPTTQKIEKFKFKHKQAIAGNTIYESNFGLTFLSEVSKRGSGAGTHSRSSHNAASVAERPHTSKYINE